MSSVYILFEFFFFYFQVDRVRHFLHFFHKGDQSWFHQLDKGPGCSGDWCSPMVNYNRKVDLWEVISNRFKRAVVLARRQAREHALREGGDADKAAQAVSLRMESAEEKAKLWVVRVSYLPPPCFD
jgi:hypothetical protein